MNSDSEKPIQNDGSANYYYEKLSTSEPPSNESGRRSRVSVWEFRLGELADYRKKHGHCNIPISYSSERSKLAHWVTTQRRQYKLQKEGKASPMTLSRIQELEGIGLDWGICYDTWEDRLSERADDRRIYEHYNGPQYYS